ncbi:MAG: TonB-dependent receptor [Acidobacteriota bacterium]
MRFISRTLLTLVLLVTASTAWAAETGSISGSVTDSGGLGVPGAMVRVFGAQNPAGRTAITSAKGAYNFPVLIPGKYTVEASLQGLGKAASTVQVQVDVDAQVDLRLVQSAKAEVTVTAAAAEVDKKSAEVNANFTDNEIKSLPLARTYEGILNLIPGAAATAGNGYVSVAGGTRQDNKYMVDGVNITNPGYGYLQVDTNELDIADVNIKKGGISAEFGRTSGAMVNAVTKSGTNDIHGGVRFEAQPASFIAAPVTGASTQTTDRYTGAANIGFPIVKDMLFGYASGRYFSATSTGQGSQYGSLPDTKTKNQDYFGKLTAYLGSSFLLNAGFRALPNKVTDGFDSLFDTPKAAWNSDTTNYVTSVVANWFVNKDSYVEAKFVHLTENDTLQAQNTLTGQPRTIDPANLGNYGAFYDTTNRSGGNAGFYEFANFGDSYKRDEIKLTASRFFDLGEAQNQLKVGGGYENDTYDLVRATNGWGAFISSSTCPASVCGTSRSGQIRARYYTLQPEQNSKARTYSAFIQDQITWKRLTATVGVLVNKDDFAQVCQPGVVCGTTVVTDETRYNFMSFDWKDEIQPRIGLAYNAELLAGDKFYGSFGRYMSLDQKSTARSFAPFRIRQDQAWFDKVTGAYLGQQIRGSSGGKVIPADLKPPSYQEFVLGYAAPLGRDFSFEVYYQQRALKDAFEDVPIDPNNYFGSFAAANIEGATRNYRGVTLDLTKRYSHGWYANVNYTYSELRGNFDEEYGLGLFNTSSLLEDNPGINSAEPNRNGTLGQDRPHILKIFASYDLPYGFSLGGFYRLQSGAAWQATGMDANGSFLRYLEQAGSRRLPTWSNLDLLLGYTFKLGGDMGLRLEGRVQNVFNTQTISAVDRTQYFDDYVDGTPARNLGPQGTTKPNPNFGTPTSYTSARRFLLTALFNF